MSRLWTPPNATVQPTERKWDGGSQFDDELIFITDKDKDLAKEGARLVDHLQQRPDHTVYVGSVESRDELRSVFNLWYQSGALNYHPDIKIDYGVVDGSIRIGE